MSGDEAERGTATRSILVTTPTGKVGRAVAERLCGSGAGGDGSRVDLRLYTRSASRLDPELAERAETFEGEMNDADALAAAMTGVDAVFFVCPQDLGAESHRVWHARVGEAAVAAIGGLDRKPRVVFLSSAGAQLDRFGPMGALGGIERGLEGVVSDVVHVRAGFFMENFGPFLPAVREQGVLPGAFAADHPLPLVAVRDIAAVATRWLVDASWSGRHVVGVHGPAERTLPEVAAALAGAMGRDVRYQPLPPAEYGAMAGRFGASPGVVAELVETLERWAELKMDYCAEPRTAETTTPTTLEDFVSELIPSG